MTKKYMERYRISLVIRKVQMEIKMRRFQYIPKRRANIKKTDNSKHGCKYRATGTLKNCQWEYKMPKPL